MSILEIAIKLHSKQTAKLKQDPDFSESEKLVIERWMLKDLQVTQQLFSK
jgi:hypothetical protein